MVLIATSRNNNSLSSTVLYNLPLITSVSGWLWNLNWLIILFLKELFNDTKHSCFFYQVKLPSAMGFFTIDPYCNRTHCYLVNKVPTFDRKPYKVKFSRVQLSFQKGTYIPQSHFTITFKGINSSEFVESRTCVSAFTGKLLVKMRVFKYSNWVTDVCNSKTQPHGHFYLLNNILIRNKEKIRCKFYFIPGRAKGVLLYWKWKETFIFTQICFCGKVV